MLDMTTAPRPSFGEALRVWFKVGCLSFGGPAGQIALMHRIVVDEKKWLPEPQFLHALNFCMLLPGPEATELATYAGWLLHGVRGGLVAGLFFVVPGALVMLGLSLLYVYGRGLGPVDGALFGIKAAVLVIVVEALIRIGRRALKSHLLVAMAGLGFIGIYFFALPFPLIVVAAALTGFLVAQRAPEQLALSETASAVVPARPGRWRQFFVSSALGVALWWAPVALAVRAARRRPCAGGGRPVLLQAGGGHLRRRLCGARLYGAAGGREARLALARREMVDGLGLAETTPGPLILVTQFVGFIAAFRDPAPFTPLVAGLLGAAMTAWVTFVPPILWIFAGAPFIEELRGNKRLAGALAAITAAVVGVMLNLSVWFALHVLFGACHRNAFGPDALVRLRSQRARHACRRARRDRGPSDVSISPRPDRSRRRHGAARHGHAFLRLKFAPDRALVPAAQRQMRQRRTARNR